jgi:hypothetical protein
MREEEEMRKQEEMERMQRMQRGVIFTIGQDGPFDRVVDVEPFVPPVRPMTLQDYENSEKEKADLLEIQARFNFRNEEADLLKARLHLNEEENRRHLKRLNDSFEKYDMSDFEGGQRKKKKYKQTQTRQKKQHRRRHRRRSTRKYKK